MIWTLILMLSGAPSAPPALATIPGLPSVDDCARIGSAWAGTLPERNYQCVANNLPQRQ